MVISVDTGNKQIKTALEEAKNTPKIPTVIEFIIEPEENVLPIVPPGNPLSDMMMGGSAHDEKRDGLVYLLKMRLVCWHGFRDYFLENPITWIA